MSIIVTQSNVKAVEFSGVVTRCGCSEIDKQLPTWHAFHNKPCPKAKKVENLGTLAYYHKNPIIRLMWKLKRYLTNK